MFTATWALEIITAAGVTTEDAWVEISDTIAGAVWMALDKREGRARTIAAEERRAERCARIADALTAQIAE